MKKFLIATLIALPLFAQAPTQTTLPSITVSGTGNVKVVPDRVSFTVGVETEKASVREAFAENNLRTQRVVEALKRAGVKATEIQTSNFAISTPYDERGRRMSSFVVTNTVTVTREDPKGVSELLQVAVDAGANQAHGVRFFVADPTAARDRALEKAYRDARGRAEKLVAAAGRMLGEPITITTAPAAYPYAQNVVAEAITVTAGAPAIEAGVTDITFTVNVTFALK